MLMLCSLACRSLIHAGMHRSPVKFKCEIRARSPEAEALIGLAAVDADA